MSLIFATQLAAVATAVLAVFAIATAWYARRAYRAQTAELGILLADSKRQEDERRRAQAARVFMGLPSDPGPLICPFAENASDFPVYDAQFWYSGPDELSEPDDLGVILPRRACSGNQIFRPDEALAYTILTFRDAETVEWVRMQDGTFSEQTSATTRESVLAALAAQRDAIDARARAQAASRIQPPGVTRSGQAEQSQADTPGG